MKFYTIQERSRKSFFLFPFSEALNLLYLHNASLYTTRQKENPAWVARPP